MSTPSISSLYFKCLYGDVHVKLPAGVYVAVGLKTAIVQMQLDACVKLRISQASFRL